MEKRETRTIERGSSWPHRIYTWIRAKIASVGLFLYLRWLMWRLR